MNHPSFDPERFFRHEAPASLQAWIDSLVDFIAGVHGAALADDAVRGMVRALWNGIEVHDPRAATR